MTTPAAAPLVDTLDARSLPTDELLTRAQTQYRANQMVRVSNFPTDATRFIEFVSAWGDPLPYYAADGVGVHPQHPAIHHVRYDRKAADRGELHALDGPLSVHSAQSLRDPRPRCFAMLMVHPGWRDGEPNTNGESLLVRWRDGVRSLAARDPSRCAAILAQLCQPATFPGGTRLTLIYPLPDAVDDHDVGIRMKYGLADIWADHELTELTEALTSLLAEIDRVTHTVALDAGDLVIVDNDRWAHGRRAVRGQRPDGDMRTNPRELWSVTLR